MDSGDPDRVVAMREDFQRVMKKRYEDTIKRLTGRNVVAFLSQAHVEPDITIDGQWHRLTPGLTLLIQPGAKHELTNNGWEPFIYVASFSASMRGTLFEDPTAVGARPIASYR